MDDQILETLWDVHARYRIPGQIVRYEKFVNGHINDTYRVCIQEGPDACREYIFQRINGYVFKDPVKVMDNIRAVTAHWETAGQKACCGIIRFMDARAGTNYTFVEDHCWRVCRFVENSVSFETVEDPRVLRSAGVAFGQFQNVLADFPMSMLHETIPGFHDTEKRLDFLFASAAADSMGRTYEVDKELSFFRENAQVATTLCRMQAAGEIPLRVTHNDTKYNNILMDRDTCEPLCVIDLDTVMPGLSVLDYGDAIRFAANNAVEDETELSRVGLHEENFEEFTNGFIGTSKNFLTKNEIDHMALGAVVITMELASRFLADHINGDRYFRIHRANHNLERARCQIRLAEDMLLKYDAMCATVGRYYQ